MYKTKKNYCQTIGYRKKQNNNSKPEKREKIQQNTSVSLNSSEKILKFTESTHAHYRQKILTLTNNSKIRQPILVSNSALVNIKDCFEYHDLIRV